MRLFSGQLPAQAQFLPGRCSARLTNFASLERSLRSTPSPVKKHQPQNKECHARINISIG